jgi:alkyl sulfatase BDS1-like metallo-beta-lactamase superfamily hydrolase
VWEEYTGWFRGESTTELYAIAPKSIWPELAKLAGGAAALAQAAQRCVAAGRPVEGLHFTEIALTAEPSSRAAREAELAALEQLADATGGLTFDELGWLQSAIAAARAALGNE